MRWTYGVFVLLATAAACGETVTEPDPPDPVELESLTRAWILSVIPRADLPDIEIENDEFDGKGVLSTLREVGQLGLRPPGMDPEAYAEAYSDEEGHTYWVWAQAPSSDPPADLTLPAVTRLIGSTSELMQEHTFRKVSANASLKFVISRTVLEALDDNFQSPSSTGCRWATSLPNASGPCDKLIRSRVNFDLTAHHYGAEEESGAWHYLDGSSAGASLAGFQGTWKDHAWTWGGSPTRIWTKDDFEWVPDPASPSRGGKMVLEAPIIIEISLDSVPVNDYVFVDSRVKVRAYTNRLAESYAAAFFRDPLTTEGTHFITQGLEPAAPPNGLVFAPPPAPACEGGLGAAGVLQFDSAQYYEPEQHGASAWITVARTGGSEGAAAVRVITRDFTARADEDYVPGERIVLFGDGEEGTRATEFEILSDTIGEPVESLYLELVGVPGCGEVGPLNRAELIIHDDDNPPPEEELFSLGGTVRGVVGTGLTLTNLGIDPIMPSNSSFVFEREFPRGAGYNVRVSQNPDGPAQSCTVANGEGFFADADVTDIVIECTTIDVPDGLDPTFGIDGKVTATLYGGAHAMELQRDGRAVVVGNRQLARYLPDGSPDASFGSDGIVELQLPGWTLDMKGLALDDDGTIVAVGAARMGNAHDWMVARVLPDGTPDPTFGVDGFATLDFLGSTDIAYDVGILDDGSIVVGGHANELRATGADNDFAVARFTPAGALDAGYGTAGWTMTDIAGRTDLAYALALQPDGKVILTGRVASSGGADPDFGVVRYTADGRPDDTFGASGVVRYTTGRVWDEAADVIVQPDGRIVVGGHSNASTPARFALMRLDESGVLDPSFGAAGLAFVGFDREGDYLKGLVWDDDGILAVGSSSLAYVPDFAIARVGLDGALDTSFATGGRMTVRFFGIGDAANTVRVQGDGKILVAGSAYEGIVEGLAMTRIVR